MRTMGMERCAWRTLPNTSRAEWTIRVYSGAELVQPAGMGQCQSHEVQARALMMGSAVHRAHG